VCVCVCVCVCRSLRCRQFSAARRLTELVGCVVVGIVATALFAVSLV